MHFIYDYYDSYLVIPSSYQIPPNGGKIKVVAHQDIETEKENIENRSHSTHTITTKERNTKLGNNNEARKKPREDMEKDVDKDKTNRKREKEKETKNNSDSTQSSRIKKMRV